MRDLELKPAELTLYPEKPIVERVAEAVERIRSVAEKHKPAAIFGLMSGGHDSFSACYCLSLTCLNFHVLHINTGFGIEATREYVRLTVAERNWSFIEKRAAENKNGKGKPDPQIYEEIVKKMGFPGPGFHGVMYNRLKERALRMVEREFGASCRGKNKKRVLYVDGCRMQESKRRMGTTELVQIDGRRIWCAPILDWSKSDTSALLAYAKQPRNEIVDLIHMSGECLCGAMAGENRDQELEQMKFFDATRPMYDRIMALEAEVKPKFGWGWGERPTRPQVCKAQPGQLCWACMK